MTTEYERAVDAAQGLQNQLRGMNENLGQLRKYGETNRRRIRWVAVTVVFDICLSLITGFVAVKAVEANNAATHNRASLVATCQSSNVVRNRDVLLWDHVINLVSSNHESVTQQQELAGLRVYVANTFKQVDCKDLK